MRILLAVMLITAMGLVSQVQEPALAGSLSATNSGSGDRCVVLKNEEKKKKKKEGSGSELDEEPDCD